MAEAEETKLCSNCKREISANNFMMHEMHCRRHIGLCEHCHEPFPKNELDAHFYESHAKVKCGRCNVEVENMHMEDHQENECEKRSMKCVYCELEFPKCELQAHLDYCGSRTEPCAKCGAYIMLKDQTKHEEENCRKPEPVYNNQNRADADVIQNDPYEFGAIARALDMNAGLQDFSYSRLNNDGAIGGAVNVGRDISRARKPLVEKKSVFKATNVTAENKRKKENNTRKSSKTEYDRLLAMQLASDLENPQNLDEMVRAIEKPSPSVQQDMGLLDEYSYNTFSDDSVTIPCEFCGQLCIADELVQHQSACSLDRISSMLPSTDRNNGTDVPNSYPMSPNNETAVYREIQSPLVQHPGGIIDNLRNFRQDQWEDEIFAGITDPVRHDDEALLLPCEFCSELFPMDTLVQHQAICDSNRTVTPRPPSPHNQPKRKTRSTENSRFTSEFPNLATRSNKPPSVSAIQLDSSDDDTRPVPKPVRSSVVHKVQKPKPSVMRNGAYQRSVVDHSPSVSTEGIRTTLKKYGVETPDKGDYFTRQGTQSRHSKENRDVNADSWLQPTSSRRSSNSDRTRSTLDNLLNDVDDTSSHDLLAHLGVGQDRRREVNKTRQNATVTKASSRAPAVVKSELPSRSSRNPVGLGSNGNVQPKNSRSSRQGIEVRVRPTEADELSEMVTGTGPLQRTRANHVFNKAATSSRKRVDNR